MKIVIFEGSEKELKQCVKHLNISTADVMTNTTTEIPTIETIKTTAPPSNDDEDVLKKAENYIASIKDGKFPSVCKLYRIITKRNIYGANTQKFKNILKSSGKVNVVEKKNNKYTTTTVVPKVVPKVVSNDITAVRRLIPKAPVITKPKRFKESELVKNKVKNNSELIKAEDLVMTNNGKPYTVSALFKMASNKSVCGESREKFKNLLKTSDKIKVIEKKIRKQIRTTVVPKFEVSDLEPMSVPKKVKTCRRNPYKSFIERVTTEIMEKENCDKETAEKKAHDKWCERLPRKRKNWIKQAISKMTSSSEKPIPTPRLLTDDNVRYYEEALKGIIANGGELSFLNTGRHLGFSSWEWVDFCRDFFDKKSSVAQWFMVDDNFKVEVRNQKWTIQYNK